MSAPGHVAAILRASDRQRYFSTLFLPERHRGPAQALLAFNAEIASIRDRVSDPAAGEIRLRWWRDALAGTRHGDVGRSPVAAALFAALDTYRLPADALIRLVDARRFDLYDDPMPDVASFEGYAGETVSVLYQLIAAMLADGRFPENGDAAGHLGVAHALVGHLGVFRDNARRGRLYLPLDVFAAAGAADAPAEPDRAEVRAALGMLGEMAAGHLDRAEAAIRVLPAALRPAFCPLPVLRLALRRVQDGGRGEVADWRCLAAMARWLLRRPQAPAM